MLYAFLWVIPRRQTPGNYPEENIQQMLNLLVHHVNNRLQKVKEGKMTQVAVQGKNCRFKAKRHEGYKRTP
jgi:hypothetical protein